MHIVEHMLHQYEFPEEVRDWDSLIHRPNLLSCVRMCIAAGRPAGCPSGFHGWRRLSPSPSWR